MLRHPRYEIKPTSSPKITPSIRSAIDTLDLDHVFVVHAGEHTFALADDITALRTHDLLFEEDWRDRL